MKWVLEDRIKHRLIGLVVIASLLIIFLPAILKQSNRSFDDTMNLSFKLPKKPALPQLSLMDKDHLFKEIKVAKITIPPVAHVYAHKNKAISLSEQAIQVAKNTEPALSLEKKSKSLLSHFKDGDIYTIQLATFTKQTNAQSLVESLRNKGFDASMQLSTNKQGPQYHVSVGQLRYRDQAIDLKKKLVNNTQLNGIIVKTKVS
jgi:DedD protein